MITQQWKSVTKKNTYKTDIPRSGVNTDIPRIKQSDTKQTSMECGDQNAPSLTQEPKILDDDECWKKDSMLDGPVCPILFFRSLEVMLLPPPHSLTKEARPFNNLWFTTRHTLYICHRQMHQQLLVHQPRKGWDFNEKKWPNSLSNRQQEDETVWNHYREDRFSLAKKGTRGKRVRENERGQSK